MFSVISASSFFSSSFHAFIGFSFSPAHSSGVAAVSGLFNPSEMMSNSSLKYTERLAPDGDDEDEETLFATERDP